MYNMRQNVAPNTVWSVIKQLSCHNVLAMLLMLAAIRRTQNCLGIHGEGFASGSQLSAAVL